MILAVDTGGTKTLVALMTEGGKISKSMKFPTPATPEQYVAKLRDVVDSNFAGHDVTCAVIALPGIIKDGVAVWCSSLKWRNFEAAKALKGLYGAAPIYIENDANLAGLGEARTLKPTPASVLYVTVSTGIGTGIITNGHIDAALRNSEGGHALVEYDGVVRTWESFASGKSIYKTYHRFAADITSKATWEQIADRISRGFLAVIPLLQPDVIIIGGSIGTYFGRYSPELEAILIDKLPDHIDCPVIMQAAHPEKAVVYGCFYYARDLSH